MKDIVKQIKQITNNTKIHQTKLNGVLEEMKRRTAFWEQPDLNRPLNKGNNLAPGSKVNVGPAYYNRQRGTWVSLNMQPLYS